MAYPGGKNGAGVYQRIISMMPPHRVYIEPFMGGAAILRLKRPAALNIAMDLWAPAVEEFRKLLPPLDAACEVRAFLETVSPGLASSADPARTGDADLHARTADASGHLTAPGDGGSARVTIADTTRSSDGRSTIAESGERPRRAASLKAMPPAVAPKWTILQRDGLEFLENASPDLTGSAETVVYCDPPYLHSTRSTKTVVNGWKARQTAGGWNGLYQHEMTDVDHRRLLRWAIAAKCRVMISGYWSTMYGSTLRNWRCSRFQAMTRGGLAEECLWANFPEPDELHDYRYLGEGFRERERIKRKKSRWMARLAGMPLLERRCLMSALAEAQALGYQGAPGERL